MTPNEIQRVLAVAGFYRGAIDGILGDQSAKAIDAVLDGHDNWSIQRRGVAAVQVILNSMQINAGAVDGLAGNLTQGAMLEWEHRQVRSTPFELDRTPIRPSTGKENIGFPLQRNCAAYYGRPGPEIVAQLATFEPPYDMVIDYEQGQRVKTITLHKKCIKSAEQAYKLVLAEYGFYRIKELGLDRFAGSYVPRKMRGGTSWSMHAYGCAIDTFAGKNGLTTRAPQALFSHVEYKKWFDIWESVGWVSLGREIGRDWMHVQAAKLQ